MDHTITDAFLNRSSATGSAGTTSGMLIERCCIWKRRPAARQTTSASPEGRNV
jgi:hypothetical protein